MPRAAPALTDLLCENCGYILTHTPAGHPCPECGTPADRSLPHNRTPTPLERAGWRGYIPTLLRVLLSPGRFFRTIDTARRPWAERSVSLPMHLIASIIIVIAIVVHWQTTFGFPWRVHYMNTILMIALFWIVVGVVLLQLLTALAAKLTAWEARLRGGRFSNALASRGLAYHSPHVVIASLPLMFTALGYALALGLRGTPPFAIETYIYLMCGVTVLSAGYLFLTFWRCFKQLLYANTPAVVMEQA